MVQEEYKRRRQKLFQTLPPDSVLVLKAAPECIRNGDTHFPYRQDSNFYYLTGFDEPNALALFFSSGRYILFCEDRDPVKVCWEGPVIGPKAACQQLGANEAYDIKTLSQQLSGLLAGHQIIFGDEKSLTDLVTPTHSPHKLLAEMRLFKSSHEIRLLKKASDISALAHIEAMQLSAPGLFEYSLEAKLLDSFVRQGARAVAYPSIVGAGKNACTLHYIKNNSPLQDGDLVLIDAGAEYHYYAADITRTFPVNGRFTSPQKDLYEVVLAAQLAGIDAVQLGQPYEAIQAAILSVMVPGLIDLKILSGSVESVLAAQDYRRVYMHGSGHWLGMDVHDVGCYYTTDPKRRDRALDVGMVLTVEPGVYIAPEDTKVPEAFRGLGIRIEDDIHLTKDGPEVLSEKVPKTIDAIESLMS